MSSNRTSYTQLAPSDNRSTKSADGRVATEAAWLNGNNLEKEERRNEEEERKKENKGLTITGLLMEGTESMLSAGITGH